MEKNNLELIATTSFGMEAMTGRELKKLGYTDQKVENGRVTWKGDIQAIARSNYWLRTAERVMIKIGEFKALTFEDLFEGTKALPWEEWIGRDDRFPVTGHSLSSKLFSVPDCQSIVKKAVVERLKSVYGINWFSEEGEAVYKIEVGLMKDVATLTIDTSGRGLHKRGYRDLVAEAPLKETLACGMLDMSVWREDRALHDPFCGSGTIPIEAALKAKNIAPGINRTFISSEWRNIGSSIWETAKEECLSVIRPENDIKIIGTDIDDRVLSMARYHAKNAGVENLIHFQRMDMKNVSSQNKFGFIFCNPPYGERLSNKEEIRTLYADMGETFEKLDTWSKLILTSYENFETVYGKRADKKRKVYNGRLKCYIYRFDGIKPKRFPGTTEKRSSI